MCSCGVLSDSPGMGQVYEGRGGEGGGTKDGEIMSCFQTWCSGVFFFPLKCDKC